jgi:hypothetical protein
MRMMKNAEKTLLAFLKAEIVRARRHPSWEALASETDSNIWLLDLCGIPALLRSIIDKRDPAAGEKGKYALYLNEAEEHIAQTIGSWSSGSDKVENGPINGVCGFCHELRQENMLEGTSAERVCQKAKCEDKARRDQDKHRLSRSEADIKETLDLNATARSQIEFARGTLMQIIIEQSKPRSNAFNLLNFEMMVEVIDSLHG